MAELTPTGRAAADEVAGACRELEERALVHVGPQAVAGYQAVLRAIRRVC
jgi:hypothetical protein